jgi:hypothetical protein
MKTIRFSTFAGALVALLLFAGCGSSDGLGDIFGGGGSSSANEIRGTVYDVNIAGGYIELSNVSGASSTRNARVYYTDRTPVEYQGRTYHPRDLERGDEIAVRVTESSNRLNAQSIVVTRNVSAGGTTTGSSGSTVRGTVRYVDTSRRTIELDASGFSQSRIIDYDARTTVSHSGRQYTPADLQRGDEIDLTLIDLGGGRYIADRITVVRSAGGGTSSDRRVVRGTVRSHDTGRRTIELEQANWVSGFTTSPTSTFVTIQYDTNSYVEYQGSSHSPSGLERGDVIEAEVRAISTNVYMATRILLLRNARG